MNFLMIKHVEIKADFVMLLIVQSIAIVIRGYLLLFIHDDTTIEVNRIGFATCLHMGIAHQAKWFVRVFRWFATVFVVVSNFIYCE